MADRDLATGGASALTRRAFAGSAAALAALAPALAARPAAAASLPGGGPVVSFHMDRPYLDATGRAKPYIPPKGARGAAALAGLSEEKLRRRCFFI